MPPAPKRGPEQFRQGGSGLTVFHWHNQPIGFAQAIQVQAPTPVAPPVAIQPMDAPEPLEIMTAQAIGPVTLQVQVFERFTTKVWDDMLRILDASNIEGDNRFNVPADGTYHTLKDVFNRMANLGRGVTCQKRVYAPDKIGANQWYADQYYNCKITDIRDDENVDITTMGVIKNFTIMATKSRRVPFNGPSA
jgi:hypothetical protein